MHTSTAALIISLLLSLGNALAQAPAAEPQVSQDEAPALASDRELFELYAKVGETKRAEAIARKILRERPNDRQTLVILGHLYLAKENKGQLAKVVDTLERTDPGNAETRYLSASLLQLSKKNSEAKQAFHLLKESWHDGDFPYEQDLASAANESDDWQTAMESYKQLLASGTLGAKDRRSVREALDEIYRNHLPRLEGSYTHVELDEGSIQRSKANYSRDLRPDLRVYLEHRTDFVDIEAQPGTLGRSAFRTESLIGALWHFHPDWKLGGWLGASEEYPVTGATVIRKFGPERQAELELSVFEKATDSLLLESIDGRQNDLTGRVAWAFHKDLNFGLDLTLRQVVVDYKSIGNGLLAEWYLEQVLWRAEPKLTLQYHGSLSLFDPNGEYEVLARKYGAGPASDPTAREELIVDYIQRHGINILYEEDLPFGIIVRASAGIEYAFELKSFEYNWLAGASWFPKKSIELYSEFAFYSSAAASNQNSSSIQFTCGLRYYF